MTLREPQVARRTVVRRRREERRAHRRPDLSPPEARSRRSEGTSDQALYVCDCGHAFLAAVSTTVGCPSCGSGQDW